MGRHVIALNSSCIYLSNGGDIIFLDNLLCSVRMRQGLCHIFCVEEENAAWKRLCVPVKYCEIAYCLLYIHGLAWVISLYFIIIIQTVHDDV